MGGGDIYTMGYKSTSVYYCHVVSSPPLGLKYIGGECDQNYTGSLHARSSGTVPQLQEKQPGGRLEL